MGTIACETVGIDESQVTFTGMLFQLQNHSGNKFYWNMVKQISIDYINEHGGFPSQQDMPCGNSIRLQSAQELLDLPIKDIPCPCGNPKHWLVQFIDIRC